MKNANHNLDIYLSAERVYLSNFEIKQELVKMIKALDNFLNTNCINHTIMSRTMLV